MFLPLLKFTSQLRSELAGYQILLEEEQEELNLPWSNPINNSSVSGTFYILQLIAKGTDIQIRGEWKGDSCGGSLNHYSWINNPQIFLRVNQESNIKLILYQPRAETKFAISFYVFKTHSPEGQLSFITTL